MRLAPLVLLWAVPVSAQERPYADPTQLDVPWPKHSLAFLPWQVNENRHAVVVYLMTLDATRPFEEERWRLSIGGTPVRSARLVDPVAGREIPLEGTSRPDGIEAVVPLTDTPRILLLDR